MRLVAAAAGISVESVKESMRLSMPVQLRLS
jgi:hypothetical protein